MRQKLEITKIIKTIFMIPLMIILAVIGAIFIMVKKGEKDCKEGEKISKKRIEILLKKNPMLISNLKKLVSPIRKSLVKAYPDIDKFISKEMSIDGNNIEINSMNSKTNNIKFSVYLFEISGNLILKELTGYSDLTEFKKSIDSENYRASIMDFEDNNNAKKLLNYIYDFIDNTENAVKLVNECLKEQYVGILKISSNIDDIDIDDFLDGSKDYIILHINGNIDNLDLSEEFKSKVKSLIPKVKI